MPCTHLCLAYIGEASVPLGYCGLHTCALIVCPQQTTYTAIDAFPISIYCQGVSRATSLVMGQCIGGRTMITGATYPSLPYVAQ